MRSRPHRRRPRARDHRAMTIWNSNRVDQLFYNADTHGHVMSTLIPRANLLDRVGKRTPKRRWVPRGLGQSAVAVPVGDWEEVTPASTPQPPDTARTARTVRYDRTVREFNIPSRVAGPTQPPQVWTASPPTGRSERDFSPPSSPRGVLSPIRSPRLAKKMLAKLPPTAEVKLTAEALLAAKAEIAALRKKLGIASSGRQPLSAPQPSTQSIYGDPGEALEMPRLRTGDVMLRRDSMGSARPPPTARSSSSAMQHELSTTTRHELRTASTARSSIGSSVGSSAIADYADELFNASFKPTTQVHQQPCPARCLRRGSTASATLRLICDRPSVASCRVTLGLSH